MKVQHADIKVFLHCNGELGQADQVYVAASKVVADITSRNGDAHLVYRRDSKPGHI